MAWVTKKGNRWYVRWREDGRKRARSFDNESAALAFKATVEPSDLDRMIASLPADKREFVLHGYAGAPQAEEGWSVAEYVRRMIDAGRELRPTTRALYLRNLRLHVEDTDLGRTDVRDVTPDDLTNWWTSLDAGPGARRNVHQLVSKALNRALIAGDIEVNPLKRAPEVRRPGKGRQVEVEPLTYDQLTKLAEAARAPRRGVTSEMARERDRLEVLVMGVGGLRAGEVGGLRRQDVRRNGERCELRPRQQVVRETGKPAYVSQLKTAAARRTVSIPCWLMDEIEAFVKRFGVAEDGRVFTGPNGEMRAHNDVNHGVQAAGRRVKMDVNAHQLRHTAVSLLIDGGANPRAIQSFAGHSDVRMTLQTYGHLFDQGGQALADIMAELQEAQRNGS
jgi:integrase